MPPCTSSPWSSFGLVAIVAYALRQGPIGRRLHIVRDSPLAASTLGVNLTVTKVVVFVVGAMVAALGGLALRRLQQAITPQDFMWSASLGLLLARGARRAAAHLPVP